MWTSFDFGALLLVFAVGVILLNDWTFRLPRPIALLLGGLAASFVIMTASALLPDLRLTAISQHRLIGADLPSVLLDGVLALLLFATALQTELSGLRKWARPIFWLATAGVAIAMLIFGFGIQALLHFAGVEVPLAWCLVLGAILAPTDAVVVEQLLSQVPMPDDVKTIMAGESLFNDGAAVVFFFAALAAATGESTTVGGGQIIGRLVVEMFGGALLGVFAGVVTRQAMRFARDPNIAVTLTLALVLASYRSAALLELSGPIAVVAAGLTMRHWPAPEERAAPWRWRISEFWVMADELVNTLLFLLMGFEILAIPLGATGLATLAGAVLLSLAARFVSVAVPLMLVGHRLADRGRTIAILSWTGLKGSISIALVLGLPESEWRETLVAICYAVVIFSVIVQGLSTPRVVALFYRDKKTREDQECKS